MKVFGGVCDEKTIKQIIDEIDGDNDHQVKYNVKLDIIS